MTRSIGAATAPPPPADHHARIRVDDVHYGVRQWGRGAPLVLLHGFTGSAALWDEHAARLARGFRVIAIDLLGHGESDAPADPARYRMEACTRDLAALLDRLGITHAACLGYSMGGRVALAFALAQPRRVTALLLESASPGIADAGERAARLLHDADLADRLERDGIEPFVDAWMAQPLFASQARLDPAVRAGARAQRLAQRPLGLANALRGLGAGAQPSLWHRLGEVEVPTLLLAGALDDKFRRLAEAMAARLPRATQTIILDAGHATHLEQPATFTATVVRFLADTTRRTGAAGARPNGRRST